MVVIWLVQCIKYVYIKVLISIKVYFEFSWYVYCVNVFCLVLYD